MQKLLIFTDTDKTQINGVRVSINNLIRCLESSVVVKCISPDDFTSFPMPSYPEIQLSIASPRKIRAIISEFQPDCIHIATEWPIGFIAARVCKKDGIPYTSAFHTKFPEYIHLRSRLIPERTVHSFLRHIHSGATKVLASNECLREYLEENGYKNIEVIRFGIDHDTFHPGEKTLFAELKKPILLFVGRVAIEKNIEDFLAMKTPGTKVIVGDGPLREKLEEKYPHAVFLWRKGKEELGEIYRSADIFVFPSKTDTLGLVNLEALASGLPVVAYNTDGPNRIIQSGKTGVLISSWNTLASGIKKALRLKKEDCIASVSPFSWEEYARKFMENQSKIEY